MIKAILMRHSQCYSKLLFHSSNQTYEMACYFIAFNVARYFWRRLHSCVPVISWHVFVHAGWQHVGVDGTSLATHFAVCVFCPARQLSMLLEPQLKCSTGKNYNSYLNDCLSSWTTVFIFYTATTVLKWRLQAYSQCQHFKVDIEKVTEKLIITVE